MLSFCKKIYLILCYQHTGKRSKGETCNTTKLKTNVSELGSVVSKPSNPTSSRLRQLQVEGRIPIPKPRFFPFFHSGEYFPSEYFSHSQFAERKRRSQQIAHHQKLENKHQ